MEQMRIATLGLDNFDRELFTGLLQLMVHNFVDSPLFSRSTAVLLIFHRLEKPKTQWQRNSGKNSINDHG